jgi:purine-binding chemotaxis protein CheW
VVDSVSDVLNIDHKDIQPPPEFGTKVDVSVLNGIAKSGDKLVVILNIERLLMDGNMQVAAVGTAAA